MPEYKLTVLFEVRPPDGSPSPQSVEETKEFPDLLSAEIHLDEIASKLISEFSDRGYEWTMVEKCVALQQEEAEQENADEQLDTSELQDTSESDLSAPVV